MTKKLTVILPVAGILAVALAILWYTQVGTITAQPTTNTPTNAPAEGIQSRPLSALEWDAISPRTTTDDAQPGSGASGASTPSAFTDDDITEIEAGVVVSWTFMQSEDVAKYTLERRLAQTVAGETYHWRMLESNLQATEHDDVDVAPGFSYYYRINEGQLGR